MASLRELIDAVLAKDNGVGITPRIEITRLNNTTQYTANDVIVGLAGPNVLKNAVRTPGGSAYLHSVTVIGDQGGGGGAETWQPRVWISQKQRQANLADNAAFTMSFTIDQQVQFLTEQLLPPLAAPAGSTIDKATLENISVVVTAAPGRRDLFIDLQTLTTFTPVAGAFYEILFGLVQL